MPTADPTAGHVARPGWTDPVPFWLRPTSYWMPEQHPASAWVTHAPFAAWLVDVLRPREVVELGTHNGFSCFAFAEAAKRLGLPVRVNALDSWSGDEHAGFYGEAVYEAVRAVVERDYPSVRMLRGFFSESRPLFDDASVDLLHIDGRHFYDDVVEDYTEWVTTVRDGGIVLFHDIAVRDRGFGVWRLWDELAEPGRSFAFSHGHGLGVLVIGTVPDGPIRELVTADDETAERIRADFERLGDAVAERYRLERLRPQLARLEGRLTASRARIGYLESSASWRLTAPLRAIRRRLPGSR
ncbi:MAG: class I SAM-dependent methyltransferase [Microbacterium sp.]